MRWKWPTGPFQAPLKWRLTLWYLLTLGTILLLFSSFLYLQLRFSLVNQLDTSLQLVASQALMNVEGEGNRLAFQDLDNRATILGASTDDFVIYLTAGDGTLWDQSGRADEIPALQSPAAGIETIAVTDDAWRVYSHPVSAGNVSGWIQVIGDMEPINDTVSRLLSLIAVGVPLALVLAGMGGLFLARRALAPIDSVTRTAQAINGSDLSRRIQYQGPADELGRLAQTFDTMLDRLQTAFERERRFTGDAAHELRTPLAALKGRIGVTLSQPRRPEVYVATLREMEEQVDRLVRLSSDLLFMARLEQGQMVPQMEPIDLSDFLSAMVDQIRPLAVMKSITLSERIPSGLSLRGDMDLLIRLFLNLLDNAVKYTPSNGRIAIEAEAHPAELRVSIADSGPGITAHHLPHLFERFYRVEQARSRDAGDGGGAGLGLAIAYEIARTHGGALQVLSKPGRGTQITAVFPNRRPVANHVPSPGPSCP